jgi:hypothetical protein
MLLSSSGSLVAASGVRRPQLPCRPRPLVQPPRAVPSDAEETEVTTATATVDAYTSSSGSDSDQTELLQSLPTPAPAPLLQTSPFTDTSAWVLSLTVVFAARLGRLTSQEARLDVRRLQRDRERGRALTADLRARRERWRTEEAARLAGEDARRVEETAARAREEAKRMVEAQARARTEAAAAAARLAKEREVKRKEYDSQQAALDAEYQTRVAKEQALIEEARQKAAEEEAARRAAAEEERRRKEEERRHAEEEARRAAEEVAQQRAEERRRLEKEKQRFAVRLEGTVSVGRPPRGTLIPGPIQREAAVRITATAGSLLGGPGAPLHADFASLEDARAGAPAAVAAVARAGADAAASALRLKSMTGEGPMAAMETPEQDAWMALAAARAGAAALRSAEAALAAFAADPSSTAEQSFQARTEVGVLPPGHPERDEVVLGAAIAAVEDGDPQRAIETVLIERLTEANAAFVKDLVFPAALAAAPASIGAALELAHFLDRALYDRPIRTSDAPAWFEAAAALVREQLRVAVRGAAPDSLEPWAAVLTAALGGLDHPVAAEATALAAANVSPAEAARRVEKERARQAELAAKLLEEEWPDAEEIKAARLAERDANTPIAERVWALRNVAGTLAMGGPGERSRARQLLEQAVQLKQQWADAPDHPVVLPELSALGEVLERGGKEWEADAAGVAALALRVLGGIAAAYSAAADPASAAAVMEAALRRWEETAGVRSAAVRAATKRADSLLEPLTPEQRERMKKAVSEGEVLSRVISALTEQLGAYADSGSASRLRDWEARGVDVIGPLA